MGLLPGSFSVALGLWVKEPNASRLVASLLGGCEIAYKSERLLREQAAGDCSLLSRLSASATQPYQSTEGHAPISQDAVSLSIIIFRWSIVQNVLRQQR